MTELKQLMEDNLWITKETRNPSTYRGRKSMASKLTKAFEDLGLVTLADLNNKVNMTKVVKLLGLQIANGEWGTKYSTNSQLYHTGKAILSEIGVEHTTLTIYTNSKQNTLDNGCTQVSIQETITVQQVERCMAYLEELRNGRPIKVKDSVVTPVKVARGILYFNLAATFALRSGSIMDLNKSDFTFENLTYRIQKGKNKGMPVTRSMNNLVWQSYEDYALLLPKDRNHLFNDSSWLSAFVKVVMIEAGVEAHHGRHGIHRFRRALVTWGFNNGKLIEHLSPALNHKNTEVTENVYLDLNRKQQVATQVVEEYQGDFLGLEERLTPFEQEMNAFRKVLSMNLTSKAVSPSDYDEDHQEWLSSLGIDDSAALYHVKPDGEAITTAMIDRQESLLPNSSSSLGAGTTTAFALFFFIDKARPR